MAVKDVAAKPMTKTEERAIIERRFAKRILAAHTAAWSEWHDRSLRLQNDKDRIRAWFEAHGKRVTPEEAARDVGLGYTGRNEAGDAFFLSFETVRACAEKEAGPEPSLHSMLRAVAESAGGERA